MDFFSLCYGLFMMNSFKTYGFQKINDDKFLTLVGSLAALSNGGGRFLWGYVYDKLHFYKTYGIMLCL